MGQLCLQLPAPGPQTLSWACGRWRWDSHRDALWCLRSAAHVPYGASVSHGPEEPPLDAGATSQQLLSSSSSPALLLPWRYLQDPAALHGQRRGDVEGARCPWSSAASFCRHTVWDEAVPPASRAAAGISLEAVNYEMLRVAAAHTLVYFQPAALLFVLI